MLQNRFLKSCSVLTAALSRSLEMHPPPQKKNHTHKKNIKNTTLTYTIPHSTQNISKQRKIGEKGSPGLMHPLLNATVLHFWLGLPLIRTDKSTELSHPLYLFSPSISKSPFSRHKIANVPMHLKINF